MRPEKQLSDFFFQASSVSKGAEQLTSVRTVECEVCLYEKDLTPWAFAQKENLIGGGNRRIRLDVGLVLC